MALAPTLRVEGIDEGTKLALVTFIDTGTSADVPIVDALRATRRIAPRAILLVARDTNLVALVKATGAYARTETDAALYTRRIQRA